jgi:hypothetical protein
MDELNGRPRRLRERRPPWPRRDPDDDRPGPRRWEREREPFEDDAIAELYPGSLVMEDLATSPDESATLRILGRYTVIRLLLLSAAGIIEGTSLRVERRVALEHLAMLPSHDWERRSLERLARLCREAPGPDIADAVFVAAEASAKRGQPMGSFALYRAAYEMSCAHAWWSHAGRAARGIAHLARLEEARWSERLWDKRAAVLERRAELEALRIAQSDETSGDDGAAGPPGAT